MPCSAAVGASGRNDNGCYRYAAGRDKKFFLIDLLYVSSASDYVVHRRLWRFIVDEMRRDQTLGQEWDAEIWMYGPGASDDPFPPARGAAPEGTWSCCRVG